MCSVSPVGLIRISTLIISAALLLAPLACHNATTTYKVDYCEVDIQVGLSTYRQIEITYIFDKTEGSWPVGLFLKGFIKNIPISNIIIGAGSYQPELSYKKGEDGNFQNHAIDYSKSWHTQSGSSNDYGFTSSPLPDGEPDNNVSHYEFRWRFYYLKINKNFRAANFAQTMISTQFGNCQIDFYVDENPDSIICTQNLETQTVCSSYQVPAMSGWAMSILVIIMFIIGLLIFKKMRPRTNM